MHIRGNRDWYVKYAECSREVRRRQKGKDSLRYKRVKNYITRVPRLLYVAFQQLRNKRVWK